MPDSKNGQHLQHRSIGTVTAPMCGSNADGTEWRYEDYQWIGCACGTQFAHMHGLRNHQRKMGEPAEWGPPGAESVRND